VVVFRGGLRADMIHIRIEALEKGSWLQVGDRFAQFIQPCKDVAMVMVNFFNEVNLTRQHLADLRPVYLNQRVIEQCNFRLINDATDASPGSLVFRDAFFQIIIGGGESNYVIKGRSLKKPGYSHLLSQLHIFQKIYKVETGETLVFTPF
jgi:hypothetical protein